MGSTPWAFVHGEQRKPVAASTRWVITVKVSGRLGGLASGAGVAGRVRAMAG
jgi:hypothetical protein